MDMEIVALNCIVVQDKKFRSFCSGPELSSAQEF
jgi:hypothetical protein